MLADTLRFMVDRPEWFELKEELEAVAKRKETMYYVHEHRFGKLFTEDPKEAYDALSGGETGFRYISSLLSYMTPRGETLFNKLVDEGLDVWIARDATGLHCLKVTW